MAIDWLLIIGSTCIIISTILMGLLGPRRDRELETLRRVAKQYELKVTFLIQDQYGFQNMETRGLSIRNIITVLESINKTLRSQQLEDVIEQRQKEMMFNKHASLVTLSQKLDYSTEEIKGWIELDYNGLEQQKLECMKRYKKNFGETLESLGALEQQIGSVEREKSKLLYITLAFQVVGLALVLYSKI
jgi:hypothetical protein